MDTEWTYTFHLHDIDDIDLISERDGCEGLACRSTWLRFRGKRIAQSGILMPNTRTDEAYLLVGSGAETFFGRFRTSASCAIPYSLTQQSLPLRRHTSRCND